MAQQGNALRNKPSWLIQQLRRISVKWPEVSKARSAARISRGVYRCASCKEEFGVKHVQVDHIEPVVNVSDGFTGWDNFIKRLFVDAKDLQVLCKPCHKTKTAKENSGRIR